MGILSQFTYFKLAFSGCFFGYFSSTISGPNSLSPINRTKQHGNIASSLLSPSSPVESSLPIIMESEVTPDFYRIPSVNDSPSSNYGDVDDDSNDSCFDLKIMGTVIAIIVIIIIIIIWAGRPVNNKLI